LAGGELGEFPDRDGDQCLCFLVHSRILFV
jgi:hypothetical protein